MERKPETEAPLVHTPAETREGISAAEVWKQEAQIIEVIEGEE